MQNASDVHNVFESESLLSLFLMASIVNKYNVTCLIFTGDRVPDLLAGAWLADPVVGGVTRVDAGTTFVFDGAKLLAGLPQSDALLFRLDGQAGDRLGRPSMFVGDVNRDGVEDFFVGAHRADVVVGGTTLLDAGKGFLISGKDFSTLKVFEGSAANDFLGRSVMPVNVNRDGFIDLAIGASQGDGGQVTGVTPGPGFVKVFSGKDFSVLATLTPPLSEPTGSFGQTSVYNTDDPRNFRSDFNDDGFPDIVVGSPEANAGIGPRTGRAYVFSGAPPHPILFTFNGEGASGNIGRFSNIGDVFGDALAVIEDINGDRTPEILAGAPRGNGIDPTPADGENELIDSGYAKIFSGETGSVLARFDGPTMRSNMGHHVIGAEDIDKNGFPDLLIGSDLANFGGNDAGSLYVFTPNRRLTVADIPASVGTKQTFAEMFTFQRDLLTGHGPGGICVVDKTMAPDEGVFLSNFFDDTWQFFDKDDNLRATQPTGDGPLGICTAVTPQGWRGWAPNFFDDTVTLFDVDGADNIFGNADDLVTVMDIPVGDGPVFICASTTPDRIYVANMLDNTVTVINSGAPVPTVIGTIHVGQAPTGLGVDRVRDLIYVANSGSDTVTLINSAAPPDDTSIIKTIPVGDKPQGFPGPGIGANRFLGTEAIPNTGDDTVSIIDVDVNNDGVFTDAAVVATLQLAPGSRPVGSGAGISTDTEIVVHTGSDFITLIDMDPNDDLQVDDAIVLGDCTKSTSSCNPSKFVLPSAKAAPTSAGMQATTNKIYVTNFGADTMSVIKDNTGGTIKSLADRGPLPGSTIVPHSVTMRGAAVAMSVSGMEVTGSPGFDTMSLSGIDTELISGIATMSSSGVAEGPTIDTVEWGC